MGYQANCQAIGIGEIAVKKLTAEELKKLLLVKNVVSAVPHTDKTAQVEDQCMVRDVKSDKTVSAKSSNKAARCSK